MILRLVILAAAGAGAYALLRGWPEGLPVLLRACLAVLLLVGGLGWWSVRNAAAKNQVQVAVGARKPGWLDFLAIGMGILALECGFLWLLSVAPRPLEEVAILIEERFQPQAAADRGRETGRGTQSGNWLWDDARQRVLPARTNLKPGVKPEVFVRLVNERDAERLLKRQVYVRAFVLDDYQDGVWSSRQGNAENLTADDDGWIRFHEKNDGEVLHEVFHGRDVATGDVLTALQGARAVRLPSLRVAADGLFFLPDVAGPTGFEYLASSLPVMLEDLAGEIVESVTVVTGLGGRLSALTAKAAGEGRLWEKLLNVQRFIRDGYGYSLVTENPRNLDPLENFLFEEKRGHCELFATAGALMARELGVESRVAYGWAGGQYFKESGMFVFRAREAHSWVEVNLKGHGWVVMEPTPPVVLGGGGAPRVAGEGESLPKPQDALAEEGDVYATAGGKHVERVALGLMSGFGVVAVGTIFLRRRGRVELGTDQQGQPEGGKRSGYLIAWDRACEKKGVPRRRGVSLKRQLEGMEDAPEFARELMSYHYGVRYEEKPPDAESEGRLVRKISEWA